jgi:hypothetical protein
MEAETKCECVGCWETARHAVKVVRLSDNVWQSLNARGARVVRVCTLHADKLDRPGGYLTIWRSA